MPELTEADFAWWDAAGGDLTPVWDTLVPADIEKIVAWARANYDQWVQIKTLSATYGSACQAAKTELEHHCLAGCNKCIECQTHEAEARRLLAEVT